MTGRSAYHQQGDDALDAGLRRAYLERLGVDAQPPSVEALRLLHQRHAERVPYETWWIHGGERWSIDPHAAARRIAFERRGGYCYHLNGAFALLLASLGYTVRRHTGGVHGPDGPDLSSVGNHLVLTVSGLPGADHPPGEWYVDVGLGDALHAPIALIPGRSVQGPFELGLGSDNEGRWRLTHDPAGGFPGMAWLPGDADEGVLRSQHDWLSTSPDSGFVKLGLSQTRDATGVDVMHGLVLKRIGDGAFASEPITARQQWFEALADVFGLTFDSAPPGFADRLWAQTTQRHQAWIDAQASAGDERAE